MKIELGSLEFTKFMGNGPDDLAVFTANVTAVIEENETFFFCSGEIDASDADDFEAVCLEALARA